MVAVGAQALDGDDLSALGIAHRGHAGAHRDPVDVHGAGAAQRDPAAILRAGKAELVSDVPEQRHVGITIELAILSIHSEADHVFLPRFLEPPR